MTYFEIPADILLVFLFHSLKGSKIHSKLVKYISLYFKRTHPMIYNYLQDMLDRIDKNVRIWVNYSRSGITHDHIDQYLMSSQHSNKALIEDGGFTQDKCR